MVGRLIGVVAQLENVTGSSGLRLPTFLVGSGEKFLEVCPGLDVRWLASSELAVVVEEPGLEHELKINSDDLGRGVRRVSGGGVVNRIFRPDQAGLRTAGFCRRELGVSCHCPVARRQKC